MVRDLTSECYFSGMVHSRILYHGLQDNKHMCLKFQFLVTLGPRTTQMMCTHVLSRERVRSRSDQLHTHVHDSDADVGGGFCWKVTRKLPQVIRSTSRIITRTRRIERCVRNVQFRHFLIELLREEADFGLTIQKQREHTVNHGKGKTIFRGLMQSTFMPSPFPACCRVASSMLLEPQ